MSPFWWNEKTSAAAVGLPEDKTPQEVAGETDVKGRTIQRWTGDTDFTAEAAALWLRFITDVR
jgi:hypothetical protein